MAERTDKDLDLRERQELCDLMLELGPDAPTLCEGWSTADLAAHLAIRERDPRSGPGIMLGGRFARYTAKLQAREKTRPYVSVVDRVRRPPRGPLSIPPLRRGMSFLEYVVHHEDVRRANTRPARIDRPDLQSAVWKMVTRLLPFVVRRAHTQRRIVIETPAGASKAAGKGATVTIKGEPVELLLFLQGRRMAANVELVGAPDDVDAVRGGRFGL